MNDMHGAIFVCREGNFNPARIMVLGSFLAAKGDYELAIVMPKDLFREAEAEVLQSVFTISYLGPQDSNEKQLLESLSQRFTDPNNGLGFKSWC